MRMHWLLRVELRIYNPAMTANTGPAFSIEYSLKADDLTDLYTTNDKLRMRRSVQACGLGLCTAAAIFLIIQGVLGVWSPGSRVAIPFFSLIGVMLILAIGAGRAWWRLEPSRLARLDYNQHPEIHGRHRDDIGSEGVTVTSPDGSQIFIPWSAIASIRETGQAFVLRDGNGEARVVLPKRGLHDPALIPALGRYLRDAVGTHRHTSSATGARPSAQM
jgi:YcxB-like protein